MGKAIPIRQDEWLTELERLMKDRPDDDGMTTEEISEAISRNITYTRVLVRKAIRSGRMVCGRQTRMGIDGRNYQVPVYMIKGEKNG